MRYTLARPGRWAFTTPIVIDIPDQLSEKLRTKIDHEQVSY